MEISARPLKKIISSQPSRSHKAPYLLFRPFSYSSGCLQANENSEDSRRRTPERKHAAHRHFFKMLTAPEKVLLFHWFNTNRISWCEIQKKRNTVVNLHIEEALLPYTHLCIYLHIFLLNRKKKEISIKCAPFQSYF